MTPTTSSARSFLARGWSVFRIQKAQRGLRRKRRDGCVATLYLLTVRSNVQVYLVGRKPPRRTLEQVIAQEVYKCVHTSHFVESTFILYRRVYCRLAPAINIAIALILRRTATYHPLANTFHRLKIRKELTTRPPCQK